MALGQRDYRIYFVVATAAMLADNIEHVISYWIVYQKFHSAALGGFAVISHWVPYLFLGGYTGMLADRVDIRRLIQIGMVLFVAVSVSWGLLFYSDSLTLWKAMCLLVVHGLAGVIWTPASQVLIHRIVDVEQLPSAVRLNATGRYIGFLVGPALGAGLLLAFGATIGIWINAAIYLPMFVWLIRAPYGSAKAGTPAPLTIDGLSGLWATMGVIRKNPVLSSMTLLIGAASFFVGNAYQAQMPALAYDLGRTHADYSYSALLAADAAGGLMGGLLLETRGLLRPKPRTAFILAMIWCCAIAAFAKVNLYVVALVILFVAGFVELAFNAMAQTLVQMNAPADMRGRVIGVYSMSSLGLRTFSGVSVGLLGQNIGIHNSLAISAGILLLIYACIFWARR